MDDGVSALREALAGPALPDPLSDGMDPVALLLHAPGPVRVVNWILILAAAAVWIVAVLKMRQLGRASEAERRLEEDAEHAHDAAQLAEVARHHRDAPGARVVRALVARAAGSELAPAVARRALVTEEQRAWSLLPILATVGGAAPFVGLFGTVWGILDAFLRIGVEKSASLPVVAPAIGEALLSTAVGLFAAIPAVVAFNAASKRAEDMLARVEAAAAAWVVLVGRLPLADEAGVRGARLWPPLSGAQAALNTGDGFPTPTPHRSWS